MPIDFLMDGQGSGAVANTLIANNFDVGALRPFVASDGRSYRCLTANDGKPTLTGNADATLRVREWILLDEAVMRAAKPRLKAWQDLVDGGLIRTIPNGMAHTVLQYQTMTDISPATISMDGLRQSERDRPVMDLRSMPLPLITKDFSFSAREVMITRQSGIPLDTTMAELAARRVAEEVEKFVIGVNPTYSYGGGSVYGYKNFPDRITYTLDLPTVGTWTPQKTLNNLIGMKEAARLRNHYGPFVLYLSSQWGPYLDQDWSTLKGAESLRARLGMVDGITKIQTLDYLTGYDMLLVQMDSDTIQGINGMDITTVQWQETGGMQLNYKVMAMMLPRLKSDHNNTCGVVHAA